MPANETASDRNDRARSWLLNTGEVAERIGDAQTQEILLDDPAEIR